MPRIRWACRLTALTLLATTAAAQPLNPSSPIGSIPFRLDRVSNGDVLLTVCYLAEVAPCQRCIKCESSRESITFAEWCQAYRALPVPRPIGGRGQAPAYDAICRGL